MHDEVTGTNGSYAAAALAASGRRRRSIALRADYLKITKEELRKELRLRGLRISNKRIDMVRKLEKWEQERREHEKRDSQNSDSAIQRPKLTTSSSFSAAPFRGTTGGSSGGSTPEDGGEALGGYPGYSASYELLSSGGGGGGGGVAECSSPVLSSAMSEDSSLRAGDARRSTRKQPARQADGVAKRSLVELHTERQGLVLWRRPVTTLHFFILESFMLLAELIAKLYRHKLRVCIALLVAACMAALYLVEGSHQRYLQPLERTALWCAYWLGLGVLSSVGLGTGLHTFLLYLGPHIAAVTLAASTCGSLHFPEPPYPDEIICPDEEGRETPSIWAIMAKVRVEAFMWGAGTALGELPPYFMARAARQSGELDEDDLELLEEMRALETTDRAQLSVLDRAKLAVENLIQKVGFWGILACASIPNPLFDVAGIMCGHFLVPFRTFFGATLIGKAIIKMHIQKLFVIFAFEGSHVEMLLNLVRGIPGIGPGVVSLFEEYLLKQRVKLHRHSGGVQSPSGGGDGSLLSTLFERFVLIMVVYFVVSIVNSMAQKYHKRISRRTHVKLQSNLDKRL